MPSAKKGQKLFPSGPARSKIDPSVFIAETATVIGDVSIGKSSSVWFSAVVRGDIAPIVVGEETNIQDGAVLHVGHGFPCVIGSRVTIGHGAMVHGATVKDGALIGIGAIVLNGAVVGEKALIGAGAVVTENTVIPPGMMVTGVPGRPVKPVRPEQRNYIRRAAYNYVRYAQDYKRFPQKAAGRAKRKTARNIIRRKS
ncbi:MAG TPA: gamma carbonic anhydrase family protein [Nitrospiria bacterium]|nr:gamma carbonic anhydrase family protein [Nitrospiria bacterium]